MTTQIENIVLAGGGFYGYAQVAALNELFVLKPNINPRNICGTSVGAIIAALLAVGYTTSELLEILQDMDFDKLIRDTNMPYVNLIKEYGMYRASSLEKEIERLIAAKTHVHNCTFSQTKINLSIVTTNLNMQCPRIFSRDTDPDMIISKAVRMSISYPVLITPVLYHGELYGDGGEVMNFPFSIYDDWEKTIGITFANTNENDNGTLKMPEKIDDLYEYLRAVAFTLNRASYVTQLSDVVLKRSIVIHIPFEMKSMQFNLTKEQVDNLYIAGVTAATNFAESIK